MKILYLYGNPIALELAEWLESKGNVVIISDKEIDIQYVNSECVDLIVSYSYRYVLNEEALSAVDGNAVNLHISYLPWNRGANPNQWSWIEDTPKGVTIHYMSSGLDRGDIIAQKIVVFEEDISFAESYKKLNEEIVLLFKQIYPYYSKWNEMRKKCLGEGSYHSSADFNKYSGLLTNYDTKIMEFLKAIK